MRSSSRGQPPWSQSFIHQVRILSLGSWSQKLGGRGRRNPLFIKSEFSPWGELLDDYLRPRVAILYSSSQNSLLKWSFFKQYPGSGGRNPLFIKSEFSRACAQAIVCLARNGRGVAILYSSSQNSLNFLKCALYQRRRSLVAILYSSSQNSLSTSATPCPAWAKI